MSCQRGDIVKCKVYHRSIFMSIQILIQCTLLRYDRSHNDMLHCVWQSVKIFCDQENIDALDKLKTNQCVSYEKKQTNMLDFGQLL